MKKNIFLLFLLFTAVSLQAQYPLLSKDAEISLLTVSPSEDEVYTVYGHTVCKRRNRLQTGSAIYTRLPNRI